MASDNPPFLPVGTEVSAKFKGAFCEAKIKKITKSFRCKVVIGSGGSTMSTVDSTQISGEILQNGWVEVAQGRGQVKAKIVHIKDNSSYTVVFDDGDEKLLKRSQMVSKGKPSFENGANLNEMPLYNPERYIAPPTGSPDLGKRKAKKVSKRSFESDSSDNEEHNKMKPPRSIQRLGRRPKDRPNSRLSVAPSTTRFRELQARRCMSVSKRLPSVSDEGSDEEVTRPTYAKMRFRQTALRQASMPPARLVASRPKPEPVEESEEEETETADGASTSGEQLDYESEAGSVNEKPAKPEKKEPTVSPANSVLSARIRRGTISSRSSSVLSEAYRPGTVVCVYEDAARKGKWFPAIVVSRNAYDKFTGAKSVDSKNNDVPVKLFQTGKYSIKRSEDMKVFETLSPRNLEAIASNSMRIAAQKANAFAESATLPTDWTDEMIGIVEVEKPPVVVAQSPVVTVKAKIPASYSSEAEEFQISSDDEKDVGNRDLFVAKVYKFMEERATPINRPPVLGGRDLDLFRFYKVVTRLGGAKRVTDRNLWRVVITYLKLEGRPGATPTNARVAYSRWLEKYEKVQKSLGWSSDAKEETSKDDARSKRALDPKRQFLPQAKKSKEQQEAAQQKQIKDSKEKEKEKNGVHPHPPHKEKEREKEKEKEKEPKKEEPAVPKKPKKEKETPVQAPQPQTSTSQTEQQLEPEPKPERRGSVASQSGVKEKKEKEEKKPKIAEKPQIAPRKRHISDATVTATSTESDEEGKERGRKRKDSGPGSSRGSSKRPQDGGPDNGTIGMPAEVFSYFYIGQKVRALHNASYYDARVISIERPQLEDFFAKLIACEICNNANNSDRLSLSDKGKAVLKEQLENTKLLVHYLGWNARYDEWMSLDSVRIYSDDLRRGDEQKERLASTSDNAKKILQIAIEYSLTVTQLSAQLKSAADSSNRLRRVSNASKKHMSPPLRNPKSQNSANDAGSAHSETEKSKTPEIVKKEAAVTEEEVMIREQIEEITVACDVEAKEFVLDTVEYSMPDLIRSVLERPFACKAVKKEPPPPPPPAPPQTTTTTSAAAGKSNSNSTNVAGSRARSTSTSSSKGSAISESGGGASATQLLSAAGASTSAANVKDGMVKQSMIKQQHRNIEDKEPRHAVFKPQSVAKAHAKSSESGSTDRKAGLFDIDFSAPQFTVRKKPVFVKKDKDTHNASSSQLKIVTSATAPVSNTKRASVSALSSPSSTKRPRLTSEVSISVNLEFVHKTATAHCDLCSPLPRVVKVRKKFEEPVKETPIPVAANEEPQPSTSSSEEGVKPESENQDRDDRQSSVEEKTQKRVKATFEENGYKNRLTVDVVVENHHLDHPPSTSNDVSPRIAARHSARHRQSNQSNHDSPLHTAAAKSVVSAAKLRAQGKVNNMSLEECYDILGIDKFEATESIDENVIRLTELIRDLKDRQHSTKYDVNSAEKNVLRSKIS